MAPDKSVRQSVLQITPRHPRGEILDLGRVVPNRPRHGDGLLTLIEPSLAAVLGPPASGTSDIAGEVRDQPHRDEKGEDAVDDEQPPGAVSGIIAV